MALPEKKKTPIRLSLRQYIDNPYKGSSFLSSRKAIKAGLNYSFVNLLQKYRTKFYAVPYIYPNGELLMHVRVPSEEHRFNRLHYDVLFKFSNDPTQRYSLRNVKMFSNSPSFLFTYAYTYYHDDLIIDEFAEKLPSIALTTPPAIRNPVESLGFEKSTYIAGRYLIDGFLLSDSYIQRFGKKMNAMEQINLSMQIGDPEQIVQIYALGRELQVKEHKKKVDETRRKTREKYRRDFIEKAEHSKPKPSGLLIKRAPRAKLTARKAKKRLMNTK